MALLLVACPTPERDSRTSSEGREENAEVAEFDPTRPMEWSISPGESHSYELTLEAGEFIEVTVEQLGVDVVLRLFDPEGELLLEADLPIADLGRETLIFVAGDTGDYRIEVEAWDSETAEGTYLARLSMRPADGRDRMRARAASLFYDAERLASEREYKDAIASYEDSLTLWRKADDFFWQAQTLNRLGDAQKSRGDRHRAIEARSKAAALFAELEEARSEAISQFWVGQLYFELGEMSPAADHYRLSLELRRLVRDARGEAMALARLADVYKVQGETQKALDHFSDALELLGETKDRRYRANVLHSQGTLYRRVGKRRVALEHLQEADNIFHELEIHKSRAASLSQIGQLYVELGEYGRALPILGSALRLQRQIGARRGEAAALRKIGSAYLAAGDPETAREHYLQALELLKEVESPRSMAAVLADLGSLNNQLGAGKAALGYHVRALSLFESIGDPIGQTRALLGVAVSGRQQRDLAAARQAAARALQIAETLRIKPLSESLRVSFFSTVQRLFEIYIDVLMELHRIDDTAGYAAEALMVSERARARSLLDLLGEAGAEIRGDTAPELLARERSLQRLLNDNVEQMEDETANDSTRKAATLGVRNALEELDATWAAIRQQSPRYAALIQPQPLELAEIQQSVLDPETILLQYHLGADQSYLWLVTNEALEAFELPPAEEIEGAVRKTHQLLKLSHRRETAARIQGLLCDLGSHLLGPVAGKLGRNRLAIAADGALHYLPFAALPDPDSEGNCSQVAPLMAAHEIVYVPSVSAIAVLRRDRSRRSQYAGLVAVLADPVFSADDPRVASATGVPPRAGLSPLSIGTRAASLDDGQPSYARLEHTRQEAHAILEMVPLGKGTLALDFDASKETVLSGRLSNHRIVHFATHGILNAEEPALSGVVLSQVDSHGEPIDGFLRAHETYNLDLNADLVVLGACETALGKEVKGEGLIGLARGFMYAGASRVMVSLWKVSDRSTADFMTAFYRGLLQEQLTPPAALRAAQIEVRRRSPQPFYWAGFILQGEWRPFPLSKQIRNEGIFAGRI